MDFTLVVSQTEAGYGLKPGITNHIGWKVQIFWSVKLKKESLQEDDNWRFECASANPIVVQNYIADLTVLSENTSCHDFQGFITYFIVHNLKMDELGMELYSSSNLLESEVTHLVWIELELLQIISFKNSDEVGHDLNQLLIQIEGSFIS